jgi:predicted RNase H-like HicB family nuclease
VAPRTGCSAARNNAAACSGRESALTKNFTTPPVRERGFLFSNDFHLARRQWPEHLVRMKIIIEKHPDGYVAYPIGIQGVIVGEGDTFDEALHDVQSAIRFHIETFGRESLETENPALDAFVAEATV